MGHAADLREMRKWSAGRVYPEYERHSFYDLADSNQALLERLNWIYNNKEEHYKQVFATVDGLFEPDEYTYMECIDLMGEPPAFEDLELLYGWIDECATELAKNYIAGPDIKKWRTAMRRKARKLNAEPDVAKQAFIDKAKTLSEAKKKERDAANVQYLFDKGYNVGTPMKKPVRPQSTLPKTN